MLTNLEDEVALEGNLADFSLSDMFRLLHNGGKTGLLYLSRSDADGNEESGLVCFRQGRLYHAETGVPVARPGDRMVAAGLIDEAQYRQAMGLLKISTTEKPDRVLGDVLVEEGYLTAQQLERFMRETIAEAMFDLLRWNEGQLRFETGGGCDEQFLGITISVDDALADVSARLEEWRRITESVPNDGTEFFMAAAPMTHNGDIHLSAHEWRLLSHLHTGRNLRELIALTGYSDFETARLLLEMQTSGLVKRGEMVSAGVDSGA